MSKIKDSLKSFYSSIHPLIFHRSLEKAKDDNDLFDILDTMPKKYPIVWDENQNRWIETDDLLQYKKEKMK